MRIFGYLRLSSWSWWRLPRKGWVGVSAGAVYAVGGGEGVVEVGVGVGDGAVAVGDEALGVVDLVY